MEQFLQNRTRKTKDKERWVVIPKKLSDQVRELYEAAENPARYKTHELVTESCIFKDTNRIIMKLVRENDACQRKKPMNASNKRILISPKPYRIPGY